MIDSDLPDSDLETQENVLLIERKREKQREREGEIRCEEERTARRWEGVRFSLFGQREDID